MNVSIQQETERLINVHSGGVNPYETHILFDDFDDGDMFVLMCDFVKYKYCDRYLLYYLQSSMNFRWGTNFPIGIGSFC